MERFKKIYQQGIVDVVEIWVTPLLDKDGKPVVSQ